jgi:hypothetical protein
MAQDEATVVDLARAGLPQGAHPGSWFAIVATGPPLAKIVAQHPEF